MIKKGLCSICIEDKTCTFPRQFPVLQCEEYRIDKYNPNKTEIGDSQYEKEEE